MRALKRRWVGTPFTNYGLQCIYLNPQRTFWRDKSVTVPLKQYSMYTYEILLKLGEITEIMEEAAWKMQEYSKNLHNYNFQSYNL